ncbi:DNA alkylation response protein [Aquicoccus sp. SCR17]|nr:DNA alkylation response protein [Carideicomes alvinocaridis]
MSDLPLSDLPATEHLATHEVENQPVPRASRDPWADDPVIRHWAGVMGGREDHLAATGRRLDDPAAWQAAEEARRDKPRAVLFGRDGRRLDEVRFNPGYHQLMQLGLSSGYANAAHDGAPGGHVTHLAVNYMFSQIEPGVCCPLTMTYAGIPALRADPELEKTWRPKLLSDEHDPSIAPVEAKRGATLGMAMTEKQGGSDVRTNSTRAERDGEHYRLTGHKWFCSAPMSDGFLTLAQAEGGLTCFLVPRWLEGERNAIRLQRLKDKLGNHANASSEIEYQGALAHRLGEEGRGVRTIIEMVHHTRLDTSMAPAGFMRAALSEAHWWAASRRVFQRTLVDQPLMRSVLADLALDWEGAVALSMIAARAFDGDTAEDRAFARIAVALGKYLNNKRVGPVVGEAMEVLGGMGYVEETPLPMLYREAPLNGIWEGSGNVICLDILRTLAKEPLAGEVLTDCLKGATGSDRRYDAALQAHQSRWPKGPEEAEARWFCESLAQLLTAAVLIRHGTGAVADGYVATRLAGERGHVYGAVSGLDTAAILERLGPPG